VNLAAIQRIVSAKYQKGVAFNRQHPFVEMLFSDISESGEVVNLSELVRQPLPPKFHRVIRIELGKQPAYFTAIAEGSHDEKACSLD
jgi:hypothetical protein